MKGHFIFFVILLVSLIVRFYNFGQWFGFDYDQEVNAWIAKSIVVDHKMVLIGPETSVGGMYVGPFFNYVIAGFYALGEMDPMWGIVLNVILSVFTIALVYFVARRVFGHIAGIFSALIYAFSYNLTNFDRVLWNPTPMPFFSLAALFCLFEYFRNFSKKWLVLCLGATFFMFHLHFTAIFVATTIAICLLSIGKIKNLWMVLPIGFFFFLPLIIFDLRHSFLISHHFQTFLMSERLGDSNRSLLDIILIFVGIVRAIFFNEKSKFLDIVVVGAMLGIMVNFVHFPKVTRKFYYFAINLLVIPLVLLVFYSGPLPAQYFLFMLPVVVILFGELFASIWKINLLTKFFCVLIVSTFLFVNVTSIFASKAGLSLVHKQEAVKYIVNDAKGDTFKVDFITDPGRKTGFKYLFWLEGSKLVEEMSTQTNKTYKIVIPYFLVPKDDLVKTFGGVGVIKLQ